MKKKIIILLPALVLFLSHQSRAVYPTDKVSIGTQTNIGGTESTLLSASGPIGLVTAPAAQKTGFFGSTVGGWVSSAIPLIILNVAGILLNYALQSSAETPSPENQINLKLRTLAQFEQYKDSPNPEERELYKKLRAAYTQDMLAYLNSEKNSS